MNLSNLPLFLAVFGSLQNLNPILTVLLFSASVNFFFISLGNQLLSGVTNFCWCQPEYEMGRRNYMVNVCKTEAFLGELQVLQTML